MSTAPQRLLRAHAEVVVAGTRVAVAAVIELSLWADPPDPPRFTSLAGALHLGYLAYAAILALYTWRRGVAGSTPAVTHGVDIIALSLFNYLTLGSSSPLFVYFVFLLFSATIRWGWKGTVWTAPPLLVVYLVMGISMDRTLPADQFELNRFLIRVGYLIMVTGLLAYLARHEEKLRDEIEQLARWPVLAERDLAASVTLMLGHAAAIVGAQSAVATWVDDEEPDTMVGAWSRDSSMLRAFSPAEVDAVVPDELASLSFLVTDSERPLAIVKRGAALTTGPAPVLHPRIVEHLRGSNLVSAPFRTERVSGRLFFSGVHRPMRSIVPVVELVAREFGASIDQFAIRRRQRQLAVAGDRVRVARDLHDGVLQALTGIRLELQGMATSLDGDGDTRDRLLALERALAIEQRELRRFIDGLRPLAVRRSGGALAQRLDDLRERITRQWKVPVDIRIDGVLEALPGDVEGAVPQMVHEAVVNALKHGQPSRIAVDLQERSGRLLVAVTDDGRGFPFQGRFDGAALMARNIGPRSLCERVTSLGGDVTIESSPAGVRVELWVPVTRTVA